MAPTHCFLRARVNAQNRMEASGAFDASTFRFTQIPDSDFEEVAPGVWQIDIAFSFPGAEIVAEGDLLDDIAPEFKGLLSAKSIHDAEYEFHVVVGGAHADPFKFKPHVVAMIAALGGSIFAHRSEAGCEVENEAELHT